MKSNEHILNSIVWSHDEDAKEIFDRIYSKNLWQSTESVSGAGSELESAKNILKILPELFFNYDIKKIVDAPCGDFHWFSHLKYDFSEYWGIDIVENLVRENKKYETDKVKFYSGDIATCKIPQTDLIICRDCFIHLPFKIIFKILNNFKNSGSRYLLTTTYGNSVNSDVLTGQYRKINLLQAPFNFPKPMEVVEETGQDQKYLALWRLGDL